MTETAQYIAKNSRKRYILETLSDTPQTRYDLGFYGQRVATRSRIYRIACLQALCEMGLANEDRSERAYRYTITPQGAAVLAEITV